MDDVHLRRRLTAVMLADVVGYSRLMSADEEGTHLRLADYVESIDRPCGCPASRHGWCAAWATACWSSSTARSTRCVAESIFSAVLPSASRRKGSADPASHRHQHRRRDRRRARHLRQQHQYRRPARRLGRTGGNLRNPRCPRPTTWLSRSVVRGYGRAPGQKHRSTNSRFSCRLRSRTARHDPARAFDRRCASAVPHGGFRPSRAGTRSSASFSP